MFAAQLEVYFLIKEDRPRTVQRHMSRLQSTATQRPLICRNRRQSRMARPDFLAEV